MTREPSKDVKKSRSRSSSYSSRSSRSRSKSSSSSSSSRSSSSSSRSSSSRSRSKSRSKSRSDRSGSSSSAGSSEYRRRKASNRSPSNERAPAKRRSISPRPVRIYVNRLTRNINREHLLEIFSSFGKLKNVEVPSSRLHPGVNRGFAYVEFTNLEDAERAIKYMDGGQIDGQEVTASKADPPKNRGGAQSGRRSGRAWRPNSPPRRRRSPPRRRTRSPSPPPRGRDRRRYSRSSSSG